MPILSFTATSENVADGEGTIQIYCVQTQAIQQYALELSQCFPPPVELGSLDEDTASHVFERSTLSAFTPVEPSISSGAKSPRSTNVTDKVSTYRSPVFPTTVDPSHSHDQLAVSSAGTTFGLSMPMNVPADNVPLSSQVPVPLSPSLSRRLSGIKSPSDNFKRDLSPISSVGDQSDKHMVREHPIEKKPDNVMITSPDTASLETTSITTVSRAEDSLNVKEEMEDETIRIQCEVSSSPSYLITPSQLMSMVVPSSESAGLDNESNIHNKFEETDSKMENEKLKLGIKDAGKSRLNKVEEIRSEQAESASVNTGSQASEPANQNSKESCSLPTSAVNLENAQPVGECEVFEDREHSPNVSIEESQENIKDISCKVSVSALTPTTSQSPSGTKRRKNKNKNIMAPLPSTSPSGTPFTSVGSSDGEPTNTISILSAENLAGQVVAMQETLNQVVKSTR